MMRVAALRYFENVGPPSSPLIVYMILKREGSYKKSRLKNTYESPQNKDHETDNGDDEEHEDGECEFAWWHIV